MGFRFFQTFCGEEEAQQLMRRKSMHERDSFRISEHLKGNVKPYDLVALMTTLPGAADIFDFDGAKACFVPSTGAGAGVAGRL